MDPPRKCNKIRDIVRLQQLLKKWKKVANTNKNTSTTTPTPTTTTTTNNKSIKFLKKTLSFTETSLATAVVPKGYVAVCVGNELKRYVIPTEYLSHQAFGILLREAEEEFGFQQEGVLKFPCEVDLFEKVLKIIEYKKTMPSSSSSSSSSSSGSSSSLSSGREGVFFYHNQCALMNEEQRDFVTISCGNDYSPDRSDLNPSHCQPQMCR